MKWLAAFCIAGWISQYAPGVMDMVIHNRQSWGQLQAIPPHVGYVASLDCADIGQLWHINAQPFVVADCAGDNATRAWMRNNGILGEIDYESALRWSTVGRGYRAVVCK